MQESSTGRGANLIQSIPMNLQDLNTAPSFLLMIMQVSQRTPSNAPLHEEHNRVWKIWKIQEG